MKLSEISEKLSGKIIGNGSIEITNVGKIESAKKDEITFIANPLYEKYFDLTKAGAIIVSEQFFNSINNTNKNLIVLNDPYSGFLKVLDMFSIHAKSQVKGIHSSAIISDLAVISDDNVSIGANCFIGDNCKIGNNTTILPNCVIMNEAEIGENVFIYPNVSIYNNCKIGNNVTIHSGVVIGSDGFGFAKNSDGSYQKIPQTGNVVIDDYVEIGSNTTIDRATIGSTLICKGVKIDNQVQIAHNVVIGENTVIAAQVGIAGSAKIGKNCMIAGQAGIVGHIEICDNTIITASVGVSKSITKPGIYSGYRAQPMKKELKLQAILRRLEDIMNELKSNKIK
jgi:UDP-3-O-[3-hydroxymyristoyl] glucosamine N-acyltransferase